MSGVSHYERAIVEQSVVEGQRVFRVFPVDGGEVLTQAGRRVPCWNALSPHQQRTLIEGHYGPPIEVGERPDRCAQPAAVMVEAPVDEETPAGLGSTAMGARRCTQPGSTKSAKGARR
jgi:hypothetical protein